MDITNKLTFCNYNKNPKSLTKTLALTPVVLKHDKFSSLLKVSKVPEDF